MIEKSISGSDIHYRNSAALADLRAAQFMVRHYKEARECYEKILACNQQIIPRVTTWDPAYSCLGVINLFDNNLKKSLLFFEESLLKNFSRIMTKSNQVEKGIDLNNLAGFHLIAGNQREAISDIEKVKKIFAFLDHEHLLQMSCDVNKMIIANNAPPSNAVNQSTPRQHL